MSARLRPLATTRSIHLPGAPPAAGPLLPPVGEGQGPAWDLVSAGLLLSAARPEPPPGDPPKTKIHARALPGARRSPGNPYPWGLKADVGGADTSQRHARAGRHKLPSHRRRYTRSPINDPRRHLAALAAALLTSRLGRPPSSARTQPGDCSALSCAGSVAALRRHRRRIETVL